MRVLGWLAGAVGGALGAFILSAAAVIIVGSNDPNQTGVVIWPNPLNPTGFVTLLEILGVGAFTVLGLFVGGYKGSEKAGEWAAARSRTSDPP